MSFSTNQKLRVWTVDAFSSKAFGGNPASVCVIDEYNVSLCKLIAREMKHAETAFVIAKGACDACDASNKNVLDSVLSQCNKYDIRWWTPIGKEINMCGHATLAAAHVLYSEGYASQSEKIVFNCIKENTTMSVSIDSTDGSNGTNGNNVSNQSLRYLMNFPKIEYHTISKEEPVVNRIVDALKGNDNELKQLNRLNLSNDIARIIKGDNGKYLMVHCRFDVRKLRPNLDIIKQLPFRCCIVTCDASLCPKNENGGSLKEHDFVSRVFGPAIGVPEDNVSGNAHRLLCTYWSKLKSRSGQWLSAYQASLRTGHLILKYLPDNQDRVLISGYATTVLDGFVNLHFQNQIRNKL